MIADVLVQNKIVKVFLIPEDSAEEELLKRLNASSTVGIISDTLQSPGRPIPKGSVVITEAKKEEG